MKRYYFEEIHKCEMCGDAIDNHKILGQRINTSQGAFPKKHIGITVSIKKCTNCDLIYSSPQPIPFDIQDHYGLPPETYWYATNFEWVPTYFSTEINIVKGIMPITQNMKALDIGAGLGRCMISLNKVGFDTYGFEPSLPFYKRALSKMGINPNRLKLGKVEDMDYEENTFDFITFGAVYEHLYHPAASLEKAIKWLKPNGIIHIEVPSSNYFIPKLLNFHLRLRGTNYVANLSPMHAPFHLYEFGLKSFKVLTSQLNFKIEKHFFHVCEIPFIPKILHPIFRKYMEWTNSGMQLTVYLRKL